MGCTQSRTSGQIPVEASDAAAKQHVEKKVMVAKTKLRKMRPCTNEYGIAFYNFDGSNPTDPSQEVHVCKRYSEFKRMYAEISKLMASEDQVKFQTCPTLPSMPRANAVTFVLGHGNQDVVKEREAQFVKILNAIAAHPIAFQSKPFTEFIA
ncbi:unnamed protein product [Peronospora destructor]|uniref:PX domain-containing protein n=1 Tax=Peronospora destructor TaxID=86335 RepID=A0AAV0VFT5_9STRA|nr:unnamed protein product [Peronospora destructor]